MLVYTKLKEVPLLGKARILNGRTHATTSGGNSVAWVGSVVPDMLFNLAAYASFVKIYQPKQGVWGI